MERFGRLRRIDRRLWIDAGLLAVGLVATISVAPLAGQVAPHCQQDGVLALEFAGARRISALYECWTGFESTLSAALLWDTALLIPLYVVLISWFAHRAGRLARSNKERSRAIASAATIAVVLAGLSDIGENGALAALSRPGGNDAQWANLALIFALPKWVFFIFAFLVALMGAFRSLRTLARHLVTDPHDYEVYRPKGVTAWERNSRVPAHQDGVPAADGVGIALSGGGIRSAVFCMGALQSLQASAATGSPGKLDAVRYLTAVSGGGYLAGARELLRARSPDIEPFAPGAHEVDHVRRHGRYLADSLGEWTAAAARTVAGLVLNLAVLIGLLFVVARPIGWFQRHLLFGTEGPGVDTTLPMWMSAALAGGVAVLAYVIGVFFQPKNYYGGRSTGDRLLRVAAVSASAAVVLVAIVFVLPRFAQASGWLTRTLTGNVGNADVTAAGGGLLSAIAAYLRARPRLRLGLERLLRGDKEKKDDASKKPTAFQRLAATSWLPGLLLGVTALYLFSRFTADARARGVEGLGRFRALTVPDFSIWLVVLGVLAVLWLLADQTSWSLHPYYKRRLATAFAICRSQDGLDVENLEYDDRTHWETSCSPELILCAAANVGGSEAPAGRRALSFTFEREWIGGPQVSYVHRDDFEHALTRSNEGDATLLAAMAISGAAFASAMGRHSRGSLNAVLATLNLRLGVWLPAPEYLGDKKRGPVWRPGRRRFNYLLKEVIGLYDRDDRFLYVSDGGHWDNLALVELLRRRCKTIFCFDASGGPLTLVEAIRLAHEELGVEVRFNDSDAFERVREGSAHSHDADALKARIARSNVLVGTISYPDLGEGLAASEGTLIYARAVLVKSTSPTILEHAARNVRFPNDPTGDQWFDADQFENYLRLGFEAGEAALAAVPQSVMIDAVAAAAAKRTPGAPPPARDTAASAERHDYGEESLDRLRQPQ